MKKTKSKISYNPKAHSTYINPYCNIDRCKHYPKEPYFNIELSTNQTINIEQFIVCITCNRFKGTNNFKRKNIKCN